MCRYHLKHFGCRELVWSALRHTPIIWIVIFPLHSLPQLPFTLSSPTLTSTQSNVFYIYVLGYVSVLVKLSSSLCVLHLCTWYFAVYFTFATPCCSRSVHVPVSTSSSLLPAVQYFMVCVSTYQLLISSPNEGCLGWLQLLGTNNSVKSIFLHVANGCGRVSLGTYIQA